MTFNRTLVLVLMTAWGLSAAQAQTKDTPAGGKAPARIAIRDNQGKTVYLPDPNPAKPVNYVKWLNEALGAGITDNAADAYAEAYGLYKDTGLKNDECDKALAGPWEGLEGVSTWLTANQDCLKKFRTAASKRQCYFQLELTGREGEASATRAKDPRADGWFAMVLIPTLATHRNIGKALVADGWQAWRQGNENRIVENAATMIRSAHHLDEQVTTIDYLVGTASAALAYGALRTALSLSHKPEALAELMAAKLGASADPPVDVRHVRGLSIEYPLLRDSIQRVFMPGDKPGTWRVSRGMLETILALGSDKPSDSKLADAVEKQLAEFSYEETVREGDELAQRFQAWLEKPYHEAAKESRDITALIEKRKNPLLKILTPGLVRARELAERRSACRRATHLIAQLLIYHGKNHAFPGRLDDLKAANLRELRIDPFSGKDFAYKKQGEGFLLYSVGENLKDDGGQHDESWKSGDFIFWPVQEKAKAK